MNRKVSKQLRNEAMSYAIPRVKRIFRPNEGDIKKVFKARLKFLKESWYRTPFKERHVLKPERG